MPQMSPGTKAGDTVLVEWAGAGGGARDPQPVVMGVPIGAVDASALEEGRVPSRTEPGAEIGWAMYALGCVCCMLGPCGPLVWFGTWLMHRRRPPAQRALLPKERAVANVSCCTGIVVCMVHLALVLAVLANLRWQVLSCQTLYETTGCVATPALGIEANRTFAIYSPVDCSALASCYDSIVFGGVGGVYAGGSSVCGAALQSGVISKGGGGWVQVEILESQSGFAGIDARGVISLSTDEFDQSFRVGPCALDACNTTALAETTHHSKAAPQ